MTGFQFGLLVVLLSAILVSLWVLRPLSADYEMQVLKTMESRIAAICASVAC